MAKKVLIVDHATFMKMKMRDILQRNGYEVVGECMTAEDALSQVEKLAPDLVITETGLSGTVERSGMELIRSLTKRYPKVAVLACCSAGQEAVQDKALEAGAAAFLPKASLNEENLLKKAQEALNAKKKKGFGAWLKGS